MKFIDLFAGLGGFHSALHSLGHECVFASELVPQLQELYKRNFGILPEGDIREIQPEDVPVHDILCAGFPCQPFSKAGSQAGFDDERNGDLFDITVELIDHHRPEYVILENVPNFARHQSGDTWRYLSSQLTGLEYDVRGERLSPHKFGVPQVRDRLFIVARPFDRGGLFGFSFPTPDKSHVPSVRDILDSQPKEARPLPEHVVRCIEVWQMFVSAYPGEKELPSFPIWSMEFGATYPYEDGAPLARPIKELWGFRGSHGRCLRGLSREEIRLALPSYARGDEERFPPWKEAFIRQNRQLYKDNSTWIEPWVPAITSFASSFQKLEWNCKGEVRDIWSHVLQLRPSGVRVKRDTTAPSLVAMTSTQVPIVGWERRFITPREAARLQSLDDPLFELPASHTRAFEALGNAVNVELVRRIAAALIGQSGISQISAAS